MPFLNSTPPNTSVAGRRAKHIKIDSDHATQLRISLAEANGTAEAHAFTRWQDLERLAEAAERQLEALGVAKGRRAGASVIAVSGGTVANAYKFSRKLTRVRIERKTAGWYLTSAERLSGHRGSFTLMLTPAQDAEAVATLRMRYECVRATSTEEPIGKTSADMCQSFQRQQATLPAGMPTPAAAFVVAEPAMAPASGFAPAAAPSEQAVDAVVKGCAPTRLNDVDEEDPEDQPRRPRFDPKFEFNRAFSMLNRMREMSRHAYPASGDAAVVEAAERLKAECGRASTAEYLDQAMVEHDLDLIRTCALVFNTQRLQMSDDMDI